MTTPIDKIKEHLDKTKELRKKALTQLSIGAAFGVVNRDAIKDKVIEKLIDAHELIRNGGVPNGTSANVEYRMLAMCTISERVLSECAEIMESGE